MPLSSPQNTAGVANFGGRDANVKQDVAHSLLKHEANRKLLLRIGTANFQDLFTHDPLKLQLHYGKM